MSRILFKAMMAISLASAAGLAAMPSSEAATMRATYIAVGSATSIPYGWVDFCNRYAGECDTPVLPPLDINLTPQTQRMIARVNQWVNSKIKPMSDMDHWGVADQWDYPSDGYGDCEDYALLKRRLLMEEGFPRQALLMTVVKDEQDEGHAILTIKTNKGEFVLDNLNDRVMAWNETGYHFIKRQSQSDPNVWVSVGPPAAAPLTVSR